MGPVQDLLELFCVTVDEVVRVPANPSRNLPDRRRAAHSGQVGRAAVLLDELADDRVAAGEALRGDLSEESAGVEASFADQAGQAACQRTGRVDNGRPDAPAMSRRSDSEYRRGTLNRSSKCQLTAC